MLSIKAMAMSCIISGTVALLASYKWSTTVYSELISIWN